MIFWFTGAFIFVLLRSILYQMISTKLDQRSKQIFASNSDHMILRTEPGIIVEAVYK